MYELTRRGNYLPVVYMQSMSVWSFGRIGESETPSMEIEETLEEYEIEASSPDDEDADMAAPDTPEEIDGGFIILSAGGGIMITAGVVRR